MKWRLDKLAGKSEISNTDTQSSFFKKFPFQVRMDTLPKLDTASRRCPEIVAIKSAMIHQQNSPVLEAYATNAGSYPVTINFLN